MKFGQLIKYNMSVVRKGVSTSHFKFIPPLLGSPLLPPPLFLKNPATPYRQIGHPKFSLLTEMQL